MSYYRDFFQSKLILAVIDQSFVCFAHFFIYNGNWNKRDTLLLFLNMFYKGEICCFQNVVYTIFTGPFIV